MKSKILSSSLIFSLCIYIVYSEFVETTYLVNQGNMLTSGVEVYEDVFCNVPLSSINWGSLFPDSSKDVLTYVFNPNQLDVCLNISYGSFVPEIASNYLFLSWDYVNHSIWAYHVLGVEFTLNVSSDIQNVTDFEFTIILEAWS